MNEPLTVFVGVDVSKDRLEIHLRSSGEAFFVTRDTKGLLRLTSRLSNLPVALVVLGRVDGFDEDEAQSKSDERAVVLVGLLAA